MKCSPNTPTVLFWALSGRAPFAPTETDGMQIASAIVHEAAPCLRAVCDADADAVSEGLAACVSKALSKAPAERFSGARAMSTALEEVLHGSTEAELPAHWTPQRVNCTRVPISREEDAELWERVEKRTVESLPDFALVGMERVQNRALWHKYRTYCALQQPVNELELFHYAEPRDVELIVNSSSVSFDPRLGGGEHGGEYGGGAYFAQHAIYPVAYGNGWLEGGVELEREASAAITLLLAKVSLGCCKDFGARCRSRRGTLAAEAAGVPPGLRDWAQCDDALESAAAAQSHSVPRVGRHGMSAFSRPPVRGPNKLYDSVTGTEGDLAWANNPRLRDQGEKFGKQYVTFDPNQAYPALVLQLERRPGVTQQFAAAAEQEAIGKDDREMAVGTRVYVQPPEALHSTYTDGIRGVVCRGFTVSWIGANSHCLRINDGEVVVLKLRHYNWHVCVGEPEPELQPEPEPKLEPAPREHSNSRLGSAIWLKPYLEIPSSLSSTASVEPEVLRRFSFSRTESAGRPKPEPEPEPEPKLEPAPGNQSRHHQLGSARWLAPLASTTTVESQVPQRYSSSRIEI
jgi:hypothetical protein|eukprot:COSAG01_NODE_1545_length_9958_cov_14.982963_12_plen_574_part_00